MAGKTDKIARATSFIVPALNEEGVVEEVVRAIWATVDRYLGTYEIILIDDGSTDRTGEIMDRLASELPHMRALHNRPNIGLGSSYRRGVAEAKLDYVMMLCGDGGVPAASLPPIIEKIGTADIVVPYMTNLKQIKTPMRYLISRSYTNLLNLLSGQRLNYYNGLPVHRRAFLNRITMTSSGFGFQGEILVKLLKSGCTYVQVGVLGAETTNKTSVFRLRNLLSVTRTLLKLVLVLITFTRLELASARPLPRSEEAH
jgi:glycosyltransferase involved in cell wall biosynthesis